MAEKEMEKNICQWGKCFFFNSRNMTFRGAEKNKSTFADPLLFVQHLQVAVNLDKDLEHNDFPISKSFLEKAVSEILSFVDFLTLTRIPSLRHLSKLDSNPMNSLWAKDQNCESSRHKKQQPNRKQKMHHCQRMVSLLNWSNEIFFRNIAKQRQALVNLMINIAGVHLKSKAQKQMSLNSQWGIMKYFRLTKFRFDDK